MKKLKGIFSLILFVFFLLISNSCNLHDVWVEGQITDRESGEAIPNAEVLISSWRSVFTDSICEKKTVFTDKNGHYKAYFKLLNRIDIASKAIGYNPERSYDNENGFSYLNLKLKRETKNPTLVSKLLSLQHNPFISINAKKNVSDYVETLGYDCKLFITSKDTSNCDFWYKIENIASFPTTIVASQKGGIIPIYKKDFDSSFLYDLPHAPKSGYKKECNIGNIGSEHAIGLFVLCRDGKTYAKIIFYESEISSGEKRVKEFSCLYQPNGTTNLSFSKPDMDLDNFLGNHNFD
ncbi:MAG: carboxypeptidase regulatory-like domain-containing protein [Verrucomicrobia bacterium]|nr:carboxypeptidase regulatory-like domain-containing protein [Cytophagales bacterium]